MFVKKRQWNKIFGLTETALMLAVHSVKLLLPGLLLWLFTEEDQYLQPLFLPIGCIIQAWKGFLLEVSQMDKA